MNVYKVRMRVTKWYQVEIEANTSDEAATLGNQMQSTQIYEDGKLEEVRTMVQSVELLEELDP